jgi:hypothetical protein
MNGYKQQYAAPRLQAGQLHPDVTPQEYAEQLALIRDTRPAHERGVTVRQASRLFSRPLHEIWALYVIGHGDPPARIGRPDPWGVWFADYDDLQRIFAPPPAVDPATAPAARTRAEERKARLRLQTVAQSAVQA